MTFKAALVLGLPHPVTTESSQDWPVSKQGDLVTMALKTEFSSELDTAPVGQSSYHLPVQAGFPRQGKD